VRRTRGTRRARYNGHDLAGLNPSGVTRGRSRSWRPTTEGTTASSSIPYRGADRARRAAHA
jgi:hypothetical protein